LDLRPPAFTGESPFRCGFHGRDGLNGCQRLFHCGLYSEVSGIDQDRICRHGGRGVLAILVTLVAFAQLLDHLFEGNLLAKAEKFPPAPVAALFDIGVDPEFHVGIRGDDGTDIAAIEKGAAILQGEGPLQLVEGLANLRQGADFGGGLSGFGGPQLGFVEIIQIKGGGDVREAGFIVQWDAFLSAATAVAR
jgi:hypothetical protein